MTATARPTSARVAAARRKAADRQRAVIAALESGDDYDRIRVPLQPSGAWFREVPAWYSPDGPLVQLAVTGPESGRVACLVAPYTECILDGKQGCWKPGMSKTGYEYAHVGHVTTAEGETIRTANVGGGINHFNPHLATAVSLAADHYANTATRRMVGRYVDVPEIGVMFLGMLYPGTTHEQAFECMTSALSGDWRWVESLGDHEMVGSQLVNNPGFRPNPLRPVVLASVSFRSEGTARVASLGQCAVPEAIFSEWTPLNDVIEDVAPTLGQRIAARIAGVLDALAPVVIDATPMVDMPPDPVNIMDLDGDGDEGEDWADELADLTDDESRHCRGDGCAKCGWLGYTGPDDDALLASLEGAHVAATRPRDGDGDGFVYDGTPRQRPYNPLTDLQGTSVSLDILKRAAAGDTGARRDIAKRATDNAGKARKTRKRPERRNFIESTLGDRPTDANGARAWDEAAQLVDREYSRQFGTPEVPQRRAEAPIVDESPAVDGEPPKLNSEAKRIVKHAERRGYEAKVTQDGNSVTVEVNSGPAGWVSVSWVKDHWSGRLRRSGANGVKAKADGTGARKMTPKNLSEIIDAIDGFYYAERSPGEVDLLRERPIVDESPGRGKPGDQPEQLDLFGEAMIDPEPMPEPRPVTIDGDTEIPDEGTPEDLSGQTRILTPAEKSDTPIGKFRDTVAKLATREDTANADPKNGMAGMKADSARGRRNSAREAARADGYTDEQLDAVEADERARHLARSNGDTVPDPVDPPAPAPRETPDPAPTPVAPKVDADPPADVQALLARWKRANPTRGADPFTPEEIEALVRWEWRDEPSMLALINGGTPTVYVTTQRDGKSYDKVSVRYGIETADGRQLDATDQPNTLRIPKGNTEGGFSSEWRRETAARWVTPGVEARTFHRTPTKLVEDDRQPDVTPDDTPPEAPGPGDYRMVPNGRVGTNVYDVQIDGELVGRVRPQPGSRYWRAEIPTPPDQDDSGWELVGTTFENRNTAAAAASVAFQARGVDAPETAPEPDAPEAPTPDPVPETPEAPAPDVPEAAPVTPDVPDPVDMPATDNADPDPEPDRVVPTRGGFGKLPDGSWGAKLDPNNKIPEARTEAGAEPRADDPVTLVNRAGKRTNVWLTEEVSPGLWRFSDRPPEPAEEEAPKFPLTEEQQRAVEMFATGDDLLIEAGAGAGKTATLVAIAKNEAPRKGMYLAFNRALVDEASTRMPRNVEAMGFHQLAYRSIIGKRPALKKRLNGQRIARADEAKVLGLEEMSVQTEQGDVRLPAQFLVGVVMSGIGKFAQSADDRPTWRHVPFIENDKLDRDAQIALAKQLEPFLTRAWADLTDDNGKLQFKHDHYLKMWQLSNPKLNADFVMLDEAQDMSPVLRAAVLAQRDHGIQLGFVGDPAQAIYGFTGAEDAMKYLSEAGAPKAQLTKSFRFGSEVARVANLVLDRLPDSDLRIVGHDPIDSSIGTIADDDIDAILTRTNAKAVTLALEYMGEGKKVAIADNLKKQVIDFAKAANQLRFDGYTDHPELAPFTSWDEVKKFVEEDVAGKELELMVRLVDTFGAQTIIQELKNTVEPELADISLSTAHTSKGREWGNVQIADDFPQRDEETGAPPDLSPDEARLLYVAVTRAKKRLDVDAVDWLFDGQGGDGMQTTDKQPGPGQGDLFAPPELPLGDTPDISDPEPMPDSAPTPAAPPVAEAPVPAPTPRPVPGVAAADIRRGDIIDFDAPNTESFVYAGTNPGLDPSTWDRPTGRLEVMSAGEVEAPAVAGGGRRFRLTLFNGRDVVIGENSRLTVVTPEATPDVAPEAPDGLGTVGWTSRAGRTASGAYETADGDTIQVLVHVPADGDIDVVATFDNYEVAWSRKLPVGGGEDRPAALQRGIDFAEETAAAHAAGWPDGEPDAPDAPDAPEAPEADAPEMPQLDGTPAPRRLFAEVADLLRGESFNIDSDKLDVAIGRDPQAERGAVLVRWPSAQGDPVTMTISPRPAGPGRMSSAVAATLGDTTLDFQWDDRIPPPLFAVLAATNPDLWDNPTSRSRGRLFGATLGDMQIGGVDTPPDGWSVLTTPSGGVLARHDAQPDVIARLGRSTGKLVLSDPIAGTDYGTRDVDIDTLTGIANGTIAGNMPDTGAFSARLAAAKTIADDDTIDPVEAADRLAAEGDALRSEMLASLPAERWHTSPEHVKALGDYGAAVQQVTMRRAAQIDTGGAEQAEYLRHTDDTLSAADELLAGAEDSPLVQAKLDAISALFADLDTRVLHHSGNLSDDGTKSVTLHAQKPDGTWNIARVSARHARYSDAPWAVTVDWINGHDEGSIIWSRTPHPSLDVNVDPADSKRVAKAAKAMLRSGKAARGAWYQTPKDADGNRQAVSASDIMLSTGVTHNQSAAAAQEMLDRLVPGGRGLSDEARGSIKVATSAVRRDALGGWRSKAKPLADTKASKGTKAVTEGLEMFPTSWLEGLPDGYTFGIKSRGPASSTGTGGSNAYFESSKMSAAWLDVPSEGAPDTVVHELGHSFERVLPGLLALTVAHMDTRIDDDEQQKALSGFMRASGFHDEIKDEYAKKVYGPGASREVWKSARNRVSSTEYLTTGLETLVPGASRGDTRHIGLDPVRDAFILGVLTLWDPNAMTADAAAMPAPVAPTGPTGA